MLGILISIAIPFITYKLFDNKKLVLAIVLRVILQFLTLSMANIGAQVGYNSIAIIILVVLCILIPVIYTFIEYSIYLNTRSFISWYIISLIIDFAASYAISFIFSFLLTIFIK